MKHTNHPLFISKTEIREMRRRLKYSKSTGKFSWKIRPKGSSKAPGTFTTQGYVMVSAAGQQRLAHRVAWAMVSGQNPPHEIDHRNTIKSDNRWSNLRPTDRCGNQWNTKIPSRNTSGVKGVHRNKEGWQAVVTCRGTRFFKWSKSKEELKAWLVKTRRKIHGEYARSK